MGGITDLVFLSRSLGVTLDASGRVWLCALVERDGAQPAALVRQDRLAPAHEGCTELTVSADGSCVCAIDTTGLHVLVMDPSKPGSPPADLPMSRINGRLSSLALGEDGSSIVVGTSCGLLIKWDRL